MPETLRALIVILVVGLPVMWWTERTLITAPFGESVRPKPLPQLWPVWAMVTILGFCVPSLPMILLLAGGSVALLARQEPVRLSMFMPLLLTMPLVAFDLPTFGLVESLLGVDFSTVFTVVLLMPLLQVRSTASGNPGSLVVNLVRCYLGWLAFLAFVSSSFTGFLRTCTTLVLGSYIPFVATQRNAFTLDVLHRVMARFLVMAVVLAVLAIFEYSRSWLLYSSLPSSWGASFGLLRYLARGSAVRAQVSSGQPIVLGFVLAAALVTAVSPALYQPQQVKRRLILLGMLGAGLFATLSRGPWLGAVAGVLLYGFLGQGGMARTLKWSVTGLIFLALIALLPGGEKLIDLLPWIGKADPGSTAYRSDLFSIIAPALIDSPIFGVPDFDTRPDFQVLRQGEHIIDLVNGYLEVGVRSGLVGLILFVSAHVFALIHVYRCMKRETGRNAEMLRVLFSVHGTALMILATTSHISVITPLTWIFLGLSAGCDLPKAPLVRKQGRVNGRERSPAKAVFPEGGRQPALRSLARTNRSAASRLSMIKAGFRP